MGFWGGSRDWGLKGGSKKANNVTARQQICDDRGIASRIAAIMVLVLTALLRLDEIVMDCHKDHGHLLAIQGSA